MFLKADKTTTFYRLDITEYSNLLDKNMTKSYKKANPTVLKDITATDKNIATTLGLHDRTEQTGTRNPFVTLKDHKPNFKNNTTCRLINPAKSEIGIISKQILEKIN